VKTEIITSLFYLIKTLGGIMKVTIIRSTLLLLAVLAISVSIKAQSPQQYSAEIPFNFEARGEQHPAGKYRLASMSVSSPGAIGLRDMQSGKIRVLGVSSDVGTHDWDNPGTLTFLKVDGKYRLSEIKTATFNLRMKGTKTAIRDVGTVASTQKVVKINLN
jgi:hypothetical protein